MPERLKNAQKLIEDVQKTWKLIFDSVSLTDESPDDKENSIWGRKIQIQKFMDAIKFY